MRFILTWEPQSGIPQSLIIDSTQDTVNTIMSAVTEAPDGVISLDSRLSEDSESYPRIYRLGRIRSITPDAGYQTNVRDGLILRDSRPA